MPTPNPTSRTLFIGWDVGGWHCDHNPRSRDALVVLDQDGERIGQPWRGNLRQTLNDASSSETLVTALCNLCGIEPDLIPDQLILGIDAPLTLPPALTALVNGVALPSVSADGSQCAYLYRYPERWLAQRSIRPLSAIKDMIGSQTTKAMHALAAIKADVVTAGVWQSDGLTILECYPAAAKRDPAIELANRQLSQKHWHQDELDALYCAQVAWRWLRHPETLVKPPTDCSEADGWIWIPEAAITPALPGK